MIKLIKWRKRRRLAPLLSAAIPGLGQLYTARWSSAVTFFVLFTIPFAFMLFIPRDLNHGHYIMFGLMVSVWIINLFDAYRGTSKPSAPCIDACPANIEIPYYITLILEKRYRDCYDFINRWTPLVGVIGHVCHHPCEQKCTRFSFDDPVAICPLKAQVGKYMIDNDLLKDLPRPISRKKSAKVAIIGSGPAGLTAGFFMTRLGLEPTIFESMPFAGGMLASCIPSYRLPRKVLDAELSFIQDQGVEIKTGVTVGKDITLTDIFSDGYRAVFAAPGTHLEARLRIEGEDKKGVIPGLELLRSINLGKADKIEGEVVVIGGGNVAMDAARSALRLGASKVTVAYRRSRLEMPANDWEVNEAEEEGIDFLFLTNPVKIVGGSTVEGIACLEMRLGEPDESGRRRPIPIEGSEFILPCRWLIPAIGLKPGTSFLENSGARLDRKGYIVLKNKKLMTHRKWLFAGGDAVTGPSSVIQASNQGRNAAIYIFNKLSAKSSFRFKSIKVGASESEFAPRSRVPQSSLSPSERIKNFRLIHQVYNDSESDSECRRCLRCDLNM